MKKNLLTSVLAAFVVIAAVSCKKNSSESLIEPVSKVSAKLKDDPNFIPMSVASVAAIKTGQMMHGGSGKKGTLKTQAVTVQIALLDSAAYPSKDNPSFYVYNYQGGGFVIIAADKRTPPIQAYNDKGTFKLTGDKAPGLIDWMTDDSEHIQALRTDDKAKPTKDITGAWSVLTAGESNKIGLKPQQVAPPEPPCEDYSYSVEVAPLITTEWGQGDPYNLACPPRQYSWGNKPTGCVATAMAQILYYWQKPDARYNWATVVPPPNTYSYAGLAHLMLDAGTSVGMIYGEDASGPPAWFVRWDLSFKNSFGYSSADYANYDYWDLRANLANHWPVLTFGKDGQGNGHAWVCDGFMELTYWYCPTPNYPGFGGTSSVIHMNWGWNGQNDGYYYCYDWGQYTYQKQMIYNIHP